MGRKKEFICKVKNTLGKVLEIDLLADDEFSAIKILHEQDYTVIFIKETKLSEGIILYSGKITKQKIGLFTRQLSTMLNTGVPILKAMNSIAEYEDNHQFASIIKDVYNSLVSGQKLSQALSIHKKYFPDFYINLVRVGELSGNLQLTLLRLSDYYEKEFKLSRMVQSATTYPAFVFLNGLVIFILLIVYFVPSFMKTFQGMGVKLPLITQILVDFVDFITNPKFLIGIFVIITVLTVSMYSFLKTEKGKNWFDDFLLAVPFLGVFLKKVMVSRFLLGMQVLYDSGISILSSLNAIKDGIGNKSFEKYIDMTQKNLITGKTFAQSLQQEKVFVPKLVISMIKVGEDSGHLAMTYAKLNFIYEEEIKNSIDTFLALVEPFAIIILSILIGFVVIALFLPLYSLINAVV